MLSRKDNGIDILYWWTYQHLLMDYDTIVNCIAYTDTYSKNAQLHLSTNYQAVSELARFCNREGKKLVHISTDFVYANSLGVPDESSVPVHNEDWYSFSKLLGDMAVQLECTDYLICRGTHKSKPFTYKEAWGDRVGNFDYVDKIAELIDGLIKSGASGVYNVGTEVKTMYDLAKKTKEDVIVGTAPAHVPHNTTMNVEKLNHFLKLNG